MFPGLIDAGRGVWEGEREKGKGGERKREAVSHAPIRVTTIQRAYQASFCASTAVTILQLTLRI